MLARTWTAALAFGLGLTALGAAAEPPPTSPATSGPPAATASPAVGSPAVTITPSTTGATPAQALVAAPRRSIVTLLFHQVTDHPVVSAAGEDRVKRPWLSPVEFDRLLTRLERAGYHVVTLDAALDGFTDASAASRLPSRPVLLTFDDGYGSAWTEATPVLRKHHATATMFFEGQLTDVRRGRLTTAQLVAMSHSGIWTLESHGYTGHGTLRVDAKGTRSPYWYANLAWLPQARRLETPAEFEARIRADLRRFRATFEPRLHRTLDVFAYPSGEFGQNAALLPGGDPRTRVEAGHSNAGGLTPLILDALRSEGFRAAFAVSVPGVNHWPSAQDDPYALSRLGVGADFRFDEIGQVSDAALQLPAISTDDHFTDCGPVLRDAAGWWIASTLRPEIYRLSASGRTIRSWLIPQLLDDRAGEPSLISALVQRGDELVIVQQAGWWANGVGKVTRVRLDGPTPTVVERRPLSEPMGWLMGAVDVDGKIVAMSDAGEFYDLESGKPLFTIAVPAGEARNDRFAGPIRIGAGLAAYDRVAKRIVELAPDGSVTGALPFSGEYRFFTSVPPAEVDAVEWRDSGHVVRPYRLESVTH